MKSRKLGERMFHELHDTPMGTAFVCATPTQDLSKPRRFRTYRVREHASADCFIWQAARATTAAPTFFKPIEPSKETIVDAGLGCNNPTDCILKEAIMVYEQEAESRCLVSIGTGQLGVIGLSKHDTLQRWLPIALAKRLGDIVTGCKQATRSYEERFNAFPQCFLRYNFTHGAGEVPLEEWENMGEMETFTKTYLENVTVSKSIDFVVKLFYKEENNRTVYPSLSSLCSCKILPPAISPQSFTSHNHHDNFKTHHELHMTRCVAVCRYLNGTPPVPRPRLGA